MNEEVNHTLEVLKKGGIVLYPSDTIWGIGCDATNEKAVDSIYKLKQRSEEKSMVILLDEDVKLNRYVKEVPDLAWDLIEYSEKPLTIVYPGAKGLAPNLVAVDGSVAIRITKDPFCRDVIRRLNKPLVSTSANISGEPSPRTFNEISKEITGGVDYVVNLRRNERGSNPSTIIRLGINGQITILRK